jgi:hypothetical protein
MSLARLFLELSLYSNALTILSDVLAVDDQEVEAWYLEGWAFYLMAEYSREINQPVAELSWEELSRDALDCLETCQTVSDVDLACVNATNICIASCTDPSVILMSRYYNMHWRSSLSYQQLG